MTILASLRRVARSLAIVFAGIVAATNVSANAANLAALPKDSHTSQQCHSASGGIKDTESDYPPPAEIVSGDKSEGVTYLGLGHPGSSHKDCCKQDCKCPYASAAFVFHLNPDFELPSAGAELSASLWLSLQDRRPADLFKPPI